MPAEHARRSTAGDANGELDPASSSLLYFRRHANCADIALDVSHGGGSWPGSNHLALTAKGFAEILAESCRD